MRFLDRVLELERARASSLDKTLDAPHHNTKSDHVWFVWFQGGRMFPALLNLCFADSQRCRGETMCSNFMWDKGRAECSCVAHAHPLSPTWVVSPLQVSLIQPNPCPCAVFSKISRRREGCSPRRGMSISRAKEARIARFKVFNSICLVSYGGTL